MFRCAGLTAGELFITLLLSLTVIPVDLLRKVISKKRAKRKGETNEGFCGEKASGKGYARPEKAKVLEK